MSKPDPSSTQPRNNTSVLKPTTLDIVNKAETEPKKNILKPMNSRVVNNQPIITLLAALLIVLMGTITGFGLNKALGGSGGIDAVQSIEEAVQNGINVGDVIGSSDKDAFRDSVEGVLAKGGMEGEGSHHLLRPGGITQTVYLTSSVMDLDQFADHKVKVWGETFAAQKAGWLMDVGRLEIIELNAQKPANSTK